MADRIRAKARFLRIAPRKVRDVVDLVRGKSVEEALRVLAFSPRGAAPVLAKVIRSAMANAEESGKYDVDNLVVAASWVDEGPTLKRWRPRAMGRATSIHKRTSHLTVELEER